MKNNIQIVNDNILEISKHLANLANKDLPIESRHILTQIIDRLFRDLERGHSCTKLSDLTKEYSASVVIKLFRQSGLVAIFKNIPNKLDIDPISLIELAHDSLIYITKYLQYELDIVRQIKQLTCSIKWDGNLSYTKCITTLEDLKQRITLPNEDQLNAIKNSLNNKLSFITGGPGTGKTTTITLLLWVLYELYGSECRVKICAPTGKAASRVKDSVQNSIGFFKQKNLPISSIHLEQLIANSNSFGTIHKLLGVIKNSIHFLHNAQNPLDIDVLIIDESSMVGLALYSKLLKAIDSTKIRHIIFLGDKNQLSSVEEGYVFASLIDQGRYKQQDLFLAQQEDNISELSISKRNIGDVGVFADAVLRQDLSFVENIIANSSNISLTKPSLANVLAYCFNSNNYSLTKYLEFIQGANDIDYKALFNMFNQQSILCLTNLGLLGVLNINLQIEKRVKLNLAINDTWYTGRPIMILENDYLLGLYNGDIGICIVTQDTVNIVFDDGKRFIPEVLPKHQLAYALSIHKSQGSEYAHVNIILPDNHSSNIDSLCSRELIYTAVTRAKESVTIFSTKALIKQAINQVTKRNTGITYLLS